MFTEEDTISQQDEIGTTTSLHP